MSNITIHDVVNESTINLVSETIHSALLAIGREIVRDNRKLKGKFKPNSGECEKNVNRVMWMFNAKRDPFKDNMFQLIDVCNIKKDRLHNLSKYILTGFTIRALARWELKNHEGDDHELSHFIGNVLSYIYDGICSGKIGDKSNWDDIIDELANEFF